jgi:uncharacterized protein (UPF0212 family)
MIATLNQPVETKPVVREVEGSVYCPFCTRTVAATLITVGKRAKSKPGQKCPRCSSSLDAGFVIMPSRVA